VLITGAYGQLGRELMGLLPAAGHEAAGIDLDSCDIAAEGAALAALREHRSEAVINCAAWTKVDAAEDDVDAAFRANATGPRMLATACATVGARLIHLSTDFVFDGEATGPIPEDALPRPLGVYGSTKLAGELAVREFCSDRVVVRTSWLYGQRGPNFVLTMLRLAQQGRELKVVADQRGAPTWTGHLAPALIRLLEGRRAPLYHLTNHGEVSWHGFATAVLAAAGENASVAALTTEQFPTRARRPRYSVLDNRRWRDDGEPPLPDWRDGLDAYMAELRTWTPGF